MGFVVHPAGGITLPNHAPLVIAAESDAEARHLATTQQMSFTDLLRGTRGLSRPPIDDIERYWSPLEKTQALKMLACSLIGSPDTVRTGLAELIAKTAADELMVVSDLYDHEARGCAPSR